MCLLGGFFSLSIEVIDRYMSRANMTITILDRPPGAYLFDKRHGCRAIKEHFHFVHIAQFHTAVVSVFASQLNPDRLLCGAFLHSMKLDIINSATPYSLSIHWVVYNKLMTCEMSFNPWLSSAMVALLLPCFQLGLCVLCYSDDIFLWPQFLQSCLEFVILVIMFAPSCPGVRERGRREIGR